MSAMTPGGVPRGGEGPYVSYYDDDSGRLVIQRFTGELVLSGKTVRIER